MRPCKHAAAIAPLEWATDIPNVRSSADPAGLGTVHG